jgi:diacylglycerol kinase (ATP)
MKDYTQQVSDSNLITLSSRFAMKKEPNKRFSIADRLKSFSYAFKGIALLIKTQHNFRIHLFAGIVVIAAGIILGLSILEWIVIVLTIGLVMAAEIINSVIEELVDLISPEHSEKAGIIKDMAAGAVLITAIAAAIVGGIVFIPKILDLL